MSEEKKINEAEEVKETEAIEKVEDEKAQSLNDEIKEFNKEHLGTLDSPLVVHKKGDVSYEESTEAYEMNETHGGEERPTLKRHRFKKEKKNPKRGYVIITLIIVIAAVFAGLYYTGNISFGQKETTTKAKTEATTKDLLETYKGTIVVKDTYIFVDGVEVNGIEGLQNALKYEDPSPTRYEIIVEDENSNFFNYEVLALLTDMKFFDKTTRVTHLDDTGLMASEETSVATTQQVTQATTQAVSTTAAAQ